jgi:hypothetical protein
MEWIYAPAVVLDASDRVRVSLNMNDAAIMAGMTAVSDRVHLEQVAAHN